MDYDISDGIDKEMTLFGDEISVPLGSLQPLTLELVLDKVYETSIGALLKDLIKVDEDGMLYTFSTGKMSNESVYDIAQQISDPSKEYLWTPYNVSGSGSGAMFKFVGIPLKNEQVALSFENPLYTTITFNADAVMRTGSYSDRKELKDVKVDGGKAVKLAEFALGEDSDESMSGFGFENIKVNLPANITDRLSSKANPMFRFTYDYKSNIAAGSTLSFAGMEIPVKDLNLPTGQFDLSHLEINVELENTLPFDVSVPVIQVIEPSDDDPDDFNVVEDIEVESYINIAGGSLEDPVPSSITLIVNAKEGKIPDIYGFYLVADIKASKEHAQTLLSTGQGLTIKSADATLKGGITLFKYKKEDNGNE